MRYVCIRREEDMVSCPILCEYDEAITFAASDKIYTVFPEEANLIKDCKECAYYAPFRWYDYVFITVLRVCVRRA